MNHTEDQNQGHLSRRRLIRAAAGLGLALAGSSISAGCGGAAPSAREARPARVYRIGYLVRGAPDLTGATITPAFGAGPRRFVDRLAELGYVEGRTLSWDVRAALSDAELAAHAAALVELGADLIVAAGTPQAVRAAIGAPGTTPVVMVAATTDPVGDGFTQSLARPGGKLTGMTLGPPTAVFLAKRLEFFKDALPTLARLGVLIDVAVESTATVEGVLSQLAPIARDLGLELVPAEVRTLDELDGAFEAMAGAGAGGVLPMVRIEWLYNGPERRIVADALRHRLPTTGTLRPWAAAGALTTYSVDIVAMFDRAAVLVDKILRGAHPGDLPIENPDRFELVINLKTARALGLTIPPAVIARATEVIQ